MAIDYDDGEYHNAQDAAVVGPPLTISAWFNKDGGSTVELIGGEYAKGAGGNRHRYAVGTNVADRFTFQTVGFVGTFTAITTNTITPGTWHHGLGRTSGVAYREAVLDGDIGNKGANTGNQTAAVDSIIIGARGETASQDWIGRVQEFAMWNAYLNDDEAIALSKGFSPKLVRHQDLVFYAPMVVPHPVFGLVMGNLTDEVQGVRLLATGAGIPTAAHNRMIYPEDTWPIPPSIPYVSPGDLVMATKEFHERSRPLALQQPWQTVLAAGAIDGTDNAGADITNPDTQISGADHLFLKIDKQGTFVQFRLKYDASLTGITNPVIQVFGRFNNEEGWQRLKNLSDSTDVTLSTAANDVTDATWAWTHPGYLDQTVDLDGTDEIIVGVKTALAGSVGDVSTAVVEAKRIGGIRTF
ncbi:MAG: LamG-like jellyroll fold domain-containing protein [Planctomycetota bacterium]|jgi:hypothetical protein